MNLYWCETEDHDEDWFMVAPSARVARCMHEDSEGYDRGDATATLVLRIPQALHAHTGYPDHELLKAVGAVFISKEIPRIVRIGAGVYQEGGMDAVISRVEDDISEATGRGRPHGTTKLM